MENLEENLLITHKMGGMYEFMKTGIYPNHLIIKSTNYDHVWRIKLNDEAKTGVLKLKKKPIYKYKFDGEAFYYQKIENDIVVSDWIPVGLMSIILSD